MGFFCFNTQNFVWSTNINIEMKMCANIYGFRADNETDAVIYIDRLKEYFG